MQGSSSFRLIVRRGPQPNQIYELTKGVVTIGRDITNDIVINDPEVSRHHCRLTQGGGGYTLEDLGSTNGTFVNGQRLSGAQPLAHGNSVGLGETVTLAYESSAAPGGPPDPRQAATMAGGAPTGESAQPQPAAFGAPPPQQPQPGGYPGAGAQPQPSPYGPPQPGMAPPQPMAYDYDYEEEPYEGGGAGRWVVLGCGCLLVLCIVTSIIGGIFIDANCWWDDIPVISETFDLGVKADATCR